jgi:glycine/D-amino acid oxidase-like deaminating enzyme
LRSGVGRSRVAGIATSLDYLIVGQGLAGTVLAWNLLQRGRSVLVLDREEDSTSSKVAAGLINPITGRYLTKSWRVDETLPVAFEFYREVERITGARFLHEMPVVRLFKSDDEMARWEKRRLNADYRDYFYDDPSPWLAAEVVDCARGGFATRSSGYLDTEMFLAASRVVFRERDCYRVGDSWEAIAASTTVFCQGFEAQRHPLFDWVPFKSAKGEILTLEIDAPELPRDRIYNRGVWLLPTADGQFRTGSTYSWNPLDGIPTAEGRESIELRLREWLRVPFEVVGHRAAVRPIIDASKVLMGRHPAHDDFAFFNGLGSKGVSNAPFFAAQLADHLCGKGLIDPEVDLRKNL